MPNIAPDQFAARVLTDLPPTICRLQMTEHEFEGLVSIFQGDAANLGPAVGAIHRYRILQFLELGEAARRPSGIMTRRARCVMKKTVFVALCAFWLAWGSLVSPSRAQSALERLERQIRQRAEASKSAESDAGKVPPAPAAEVPRARAETEPGYLGLTADDQQDRGRGVRVLAVYRGSPAEKSGIRRQDLITSVAGARVRQMSDLADVLETLAAGQSIDVEVLREDKSQKVRVTLGERPAAERQPGPPEIVPPPPGEMLPAPPARRAEGVPSPRLIPPPPPPMPGGKGGDKVAGPQLQPPTMDRPQPEASRIEQLERRIDELERRIAELERALAESPPKKH